MKIEIEQVYDCTWCCYDFDSYDGAPDAAKRNTLVGTGKTPEEALLDYAVQLVEVDHE